MPRTKGSKNKSKLTTDFASRITEKQESIVCLTSEITSITANIDTLKADLKEKTAALGVCSVCLWCRGVYHKAAGKGFPKRCVCNHSDVCDEIP